MQITSPTVNTSTTEEINIINSTNTTKQDTVKAKENILAKLQNPSDSLKAVQQIIQEDIEVAKNPLKFAEKYLGISERNVEEQDAIKGFLNSAVPGFIKDKSHVTQKQSAWCAAFLNNVLGEGGFETLDDKGNNYNLIRAKEYSRIGSKVESIDTAKPGDIVVVKNKNTGQYHVAFYSGNQRGRDLILGGNQDNRVSVREIDLDTSSIISVRRVNDVEDLKKASLDKIMATEYYDTIEDRRNSTR